MYVYTGTWMRNNIFTNKQAYSGTLNKTWYVCVDVSILSSSPRRKTISDLHLELTRRIRTAFAEVTFCTWLSAFSLIWDEFPWTRDNLALSGWLSENDAVFSLLPCRSFPLQAQFLHFLTASWLAAVRSVLHFLGGKGGGGPVCFFSSSCMNVWRPMFRG
jgi:hypothetical protein